MNMICRSLEIIHSRLGVDYTSERSERVKSTIYEWMK